MILLVAQRLALAPGVRAEPAAAGVFDDAHAHALAAQPAGLGMELRLPKARFYQGEIIPATLVFHNASAQPFFTWTGNYDRSGRIPNIGFRAVTEDGQPLIDPLREYFGSGPFFGGGLGGFSDLGHWEITLPVNQWLRFDRPGVYRLYGWSQRVKPGGKDDVPTEKKPPPAAVELVSQITSVQIDPLTPVQEQEALAQARQDLASDEDQVRRDAVSRLRYLQTPAAREMLLPLLGQPDGFEATLALAGALDPAAEADRLLQAVASRRLPLSDTVLFLYSKLKIPPRKPGSENDPAAWRARSAAEEAAKAEMREAAKSASRDQAWDAVSAENLLTLFGDDPKDPQTRTLLVEHQLDLLDKTADALLGMFGEHGRLEALGANDSRDFQPLVRRMANPPRCSVQALRLLAKTVPEEARKMIVADIEHPPFHYWLHFGDPHYGRNPAADLTELFSALPDDALLPELDGTLRQRLRSSEQNSDVDEGIESTMLLADRFGSPALLPDVLRVYLPKEGQWECAIQNAALRFWLRCDPAAGAEGLLRAVYARQDTGCYRNVLTDVLRKYWRDAALPVVLAALDDDAEEVWSSAAEVLALHAVNPDVAEKMIKTAVRAEAAPPAGEASDRSTSLYRQNRLVSDLLKDDGWELSREQLKRLQALPNNRADTRQEIEQRLARLEQ